MTDERFPHADTCNGWSSQKWHKNGIALDKAFHESACSCHVAEIARLMQCISEFDRTRDKAWAELEQKDVEIAALRRELAEARLPSSEMAHRSTYAYQLWTLEAQLRESQAEVARHAKTLGRIRTAIVNLYGGMRFDSAIWTSTPYDKGWSNAIDSALGVFDELTKFSPTGAEEEKA